MINNKPLSPTALAMLQRLKSKTLAPLLPSIEPPAPEISAADDIIYNSKQQEAIDRAARGDDIVLIGAAGTGKTTTMKGVTRALIQSGRVGILDAGDHKHLRGYSPAIVTVAYTKRAAGNIRRNLPSDIAQNCMTIHKLLEYEPQYFTTINEETGVEVNTMRFCASRNADNPLPSSIQVIVFEEASMVSTELFSEVCLALQHRVQFIFLGDIQQLPPLMGSAILGYKMLELPVIELTEVYRQAFDSPIIKLAHRILSGKGIPVSEFPEWNVPGKLTLHAWKKRLHPDDALTTLAKFFIARERDGIYNPDEDMILIPFNKNCGTDELNKHIAQHLAQKRGTDVYEIVAGFEKVYLSVGDKVMHMREDAVITKIYQNPSYYGKQPKPHSPTLDYWGCEQGTPGAATTDDEFDVDRILELAASGGDEDRTLKSSHVVVVQMADYDREIELKTGSDVKNLILAYALTVHKAQGSEWRKVFGCLHSSHATLLQRELLYTACTRAREELYIICEPDSFMKGIERQRITGNTLAEKIEFFKGKKEREE